MSKARLMQGNEACAEGAIAAGVNFFAGYPITPSTEIAETMARLLPKHGGKFVQMEDEIASMGAILGATEMFYDPVILWKPLNGLAAASAVGASSLARIT